jgi:hypothetical protein
MLVTMAEVRASMPCKPGPLIFNFSLKQLYATGHTEHKKDSSLDKKRVTQNLVFIVLMFENQISVLDYWSNPIHPKRSVCLNPSSLF